MKLKHIWILVLALVLVIGCNKSPRDKVMGHLQEGYEYLDRFDYTGAQESFDKAAAESQGYPYDRYGKGLILERQLYYYDALNEYLHLAELFPDSGLAYSGIYRMYSKLGNPGRALDAAAKYYELNPQSEDAALSKFMSYMNTGEYAQARSEISKDRGRAVDERTADLLTAWTYGKLNDFDSSQIFLDRALTGVALTPFQLSIFSDVLEAAGLIDSAMVISRASSFEGEASTTRLYRHFERALANNYYADVRRAISALAKNGAGKEITYNLEVVMAKGRLNFTKSRVLNSEYVSIAPKNISSMMFDIEAGGIQFLDPMQVISRGGSIELYMEGTNSNEELKSFVKTKLLLLRAHTDDRVAAWQQLNSLTGPMSNTKEIILTEAYVQYRVGQFDEALKKLKSLRVTHPRDADWLTETGDIYAHPTIRLHELALETYDEALKADKWHRPAFYKKINLLRTISRYQDALNEFDRHSHFERNFHEMGLLKSICLAEVNEFEKALELSAERGKYLKGDIARFMDLATVFERKYRDKELLQLADILDGWSYDNVDILLLAARILADHKEFSKALTLAEKALDLEPELTEAKVQKGRALYGSGQRVEAFEILDQVMKDDGADGDANYYYSQILAAEKIDRDRATNMARSALRAFYSDEKAFINICQVYTAFGDYKYAYGDAVKASSEIAGSPEVWYEMGLASYNLGRANTDQHLKKAIELGLGGEKLNKAKEILAKL